MRLAVALGVAFGLAIAFLARAAGVFSADLIGMGMGLCTYYTFKQE
jgi:hypothetical protein